MVNRNGSIRRQSNTPAAVKATTADREILIGGPDVVDAPIVRIKLPKELKPMAGGGFHFGKSLGGGKWLNHHTFVEGSEPGKTIVARLEIWERIMTNGVRHANIDLTPAGDEQSQPTHELKCYFNPASVPTEFPDGAQIFELHNEGGKLALLPL